ncbi:major facilitator superfamily domain-containing protein [Schizophyllum fasciatum]
MSVSCRPISSGASGNLSPRTDAIELSIRASVYGQSLTEEQSHSMSLEEESPTVSNVSQLPPVDRGFGAWSFLCAAFMVETIAWSFSTAYGTLLYAYMEDPNFGSQPHATSLLALIGPIGSGIMYCLCPALNPILYRYPRSARPIVWIGTILCFISLLCSSYATTVVQLVALQGVLYSIGGTMVYVPTIFYMSQWFVEKRGIANGVMMAGTSLGGVLLPLVLPPLLARLGIPGTIRVFAGVTTAALLPFLPFVRGRLPETRSIVQGPGARGARRRWYGEPAFLLLLAVNTLQAFGYFAPLLWLPTFASELDLSAFKSSVALAVLNAGAAIGRISTGALADRLDPWALACGTLAATAIAAFVLWGVLAYTFAGLLVFAVVYGAFSGGWAALWTGLMRPIAQDDPTLSTTLFGWLLLTRGVGNIVSTPISTALEAPRGSSVSNSSGGKTILDLGFDVAGGRFGRLIVYTGTCFAGAAVIVLAGWGVSVRTRRRASEN